jgi:hypothetical protein
MRKKKIPSKTERRNEKMMRKLSGETGQDNSCAGCAFLYVVGTGTVNSSASIIHLGCAIEENDELPTAYLASGSSLSTWGPTTHPKCRHPWYPPDRTSRGIDYARIDERGIVINRGLLPPGIGNKASAHAYRNFDFTGPVPKLVGKKAKKPPFPDM